MAYFLLLLRRRRKSVYEESPELLKFFGKKYKQIGTAQCKINYCSCKSMFSSSFHFIFFSPFIINTRLIYYFFVWLLPTCVIYFMSRHSADNIEYQTILLNLYWLCLSIVNIFLKLIINLLKGKHNDVSPPSHNKLWDKITARIYPWQTWLHPMLAARLKHKDVS